MRPGMPVYLDCQATTPLDPLVRTAMAPFFGEQFGNPHSADHAFGWEAAAAVREARASVAQFINADDDEIVFTSGATEACNLALQGTANSVGPQGRNRIVTVATEHPAVLDTVLRLERIGFEAVIVPVHSDGLVDIAALERVIDRRTLIVSVMAANNEIGVMQPLREISALCRTSGALFHTDAAQAAGRVPIDADAWGADLLSLSAHKMYGPKGVGALFVREGVSLQPIFGGGEQEYGLRSGTLAPALVAGFGKACELFVNQDCLDSERLFGLAALLLHRLRQACPQLRLFGHAERRVPGSLSVGFPGIPAQQIIRDISGRVAVSTGAACSSSKSEPSRVLQALGLDQETAATAIRISVGRFTTEEEIEIAANAFEEAVFRAYQARSAHAA